MRALTYIPGLLYLSVLVASGVAGPLEDGDAAIKRGDYDTALQFLEPLAKEGNASAQATVGRIYFNGLLDGHEDLAAGLGWLRKAADQGSSDAQTSLGIAYRDRKGVDQDSKEAMRWLLKAANQENSSAQYSIGDMYKYGLGVRKDLAEANKWYKKSHRPAQLPKEVAEHLAATSSITLYSLQPRGGPDIAEWDFHDHHVLGRRDLSSDQAKTAIAAFNAALLAGDTNWVTGCIFNPRHALAFKAGGDTYDLLICYQCGQLQVFKNGQSLPFEGSIAGKPDVLNGLLKGAGIPLADTPAALQKSYASEAKVALKMAEQGDTKAQDVIARMLLSGRGVKKDEAEGIRWLAKSLGSAPDHADFQVTLGMMYYRGQDIGKNEAKALKLLQDAAAQGSAEALREVAFFHEYAIGLPKNITEAVKLYRQAAERGDAGAQLDIGVRLAQGRNVEQNYAEALQWLRKAAEQSHPEALIWMGTMYEKGWGVPQDLMEAYFWDRLAVEYQTIYGTRVSFRPTPEQRAVLDKRTAAWVATHPKRPRSEFDR